MTLTVPKVVCGFIETIGIRNRWHQKIVPRLVAAMLLWQGELNYATSARAIVTQRRNRSSVHRFFMCKRFTSRDIYQRALIRMIEQESPKDRDIKKRWFLIIDGTSNKRGGFTKIENAVKYKKKAKGRKGSSTKAHTFIMGILITERGTRLPVPRRTWHTTQYCRKHRRPCVSMVKLMSLMIETVQIPEHVELIVLADAFFEGREIKTVCDRLGYLYICPVDSSRCFSDEAGTRTGSKLHERGKSLPQKDLTTIELFPGKEETASLRRYTGKGNPKDRRTYRATSEVGNVAGLGQVRIVYSWKSPVYDPRRDYSRQSFKVLVTNGIQLSTRQIIEYYELRWQIEVFFREIKSSIGMCHYRGTSFEAFERHIDMVLLSFLFLEYLRIHLLSKTRSVAQRERLRRARTTQMIHWLSVLSAEDDLNYIIESTRNEGGRKKLIATIKQSLRIAA